MYVHPFLMGAAFTLFVEMFIVIAYSIYVYQKSEKKNKEEKKAIKERRKMKKPIINIERASEETIQKLIDAGVLYIGEDNAIHTR